MILLNRENNGRTEVRGSHSRQEATLKVIGRLNETFESQGRVYDKNGLSPTLRCFQRGGLQPKIVDETPVVLDMYNNRRVDGDVCGTLTASGNQSSTHCGTFGIVERAQEHGRDGTHARGEKRHGGMPLCEETKETAEASTMAWRVRKLTCREVWRLMGYTDEDFDKAAGVNSNSQLYKQAGNAIVRQVLIAIFLQLNIQGKKNWNDRSDRERRSLRND